MGCEKHPKYKAIRKPRATCDACWTMYMKKQAKPRVMLPPNKVEKDQTKYTRKTKHKDPKVK